MMGGPPQGSRRRRRPDRGWWPRGFPGIQHVNLYMCLHMYTYHIIFIYMFVGVGVGVGVCGCEHIYLEGGSPQGSRRRRRPDRGRRPEGRGG